MDNQNLPKFLNKGISRPIGIIIIVLVALLAGGILAWQYYGALKEEDETPEEETEASEEKEPESITIFSPIKGEKWKIGEIRQIQWSPSNPDEHVVIKLKKEPYRSLDLVWEPSYSIPNTGAYPFIVAGDWLKSDRNYQFFITAYGGEGENSYFYSGRSEEFMIVKTIEDETADWQSYSNPEVNFTFKYPQGWKIIEDYFYETASGIKTEQRTVTLQKIGDDDSNNWIRINPRQFQTEVGKCVGSICTYSKNTEILNIFDKVVESFEKIEIDITTGWKIYRNEEYGFEVKYPLDWEMEITPPPLIGFGPFFFPKTKSTPLYLGLHKEFGECIEGLICFLSIHIFTTIEPEETVNEYFNKFFNQDSCWDRDIVIVGGREAIRCESGTGPASGEFMWLIKDGKGWLFLLSYLTPSSEIFDQILSTFRFLE